MSIVLVSDIVEANGKTVKENNLKLTHRIAIGSLVEIVDCSEEDEQHGVRLFVVNHSRDCDGTPLYDLSFNKEAQAQLDEFETSVKNGEFDEDPVYGYGLKMYTKGLVTGAISRHFSEESLKLIKAS